LWTVTGGNSSVEIKFEVFSNDFEFV
jgi:acyl-CoA hydrolase